MIDPAPAGLPEIAGYRMLRRLGEGGMAAVYLALQLSLERQVAIKVLSFERSVSEDDALRFEREARTIAKLEHPNIVGVFDVGRTRAGELYYAMPYLARGDLAHRRPGSGEAGIVDVIGAVCEALDYAHAHGVVHRDVKPENILFDQADRPRLADFGIALSREHDHRVTGPNKALGSSGYMSPEQARGQPLDGRSDLYSLGVVCYELLTGDLPYMGSDALAVAMAHANDPVPRLRPALRHWQPFLDRALAKDPRSRYQSGADMKASLEAIPIDLPATGGRDVVSSSRVSTRRILVAVAAAGVVATLVFGLSLKRDDGEPPAVAVPLPATSTAATPATTATAEPAVLDAAALDRDLQQAAALLRKGRLFSPANDNAADRFLALLERAPGAAEVRAGLDQVFEAGAGEIEKAISGAEGKRAAALYLAAQAAAVRVGGADLPAWVAFRNRFLLAIGAALDAAAPRLDGERVKGLAPALDLAEPMRPELAARRQRFALIPKAGARLQDRDGPVLAFIPARHGGAELDHAFALGTTEVTRAEYLKFADATQRAAAKCRDSTGVFAFLRKRDVRAPGFAQDADHPVVCVTHADAVAYAAWLSERTKRPYRLPGRGEWQHATSDVATDGPPCALGNVHDQAGNSGSTAGNRHTCSDGFRHTAPVGRLARSPLGLHDLVGNVREWLDDCLDAARKAGRACGVVGSSYEDGAKQPLLGATQLPEDVAQPDLGFRLVRELTLDTLPTAAR